MWYILITVNTSFLFSALQTEELKLQIQFMFHRHGKECFGDKLACWCACDCKWLKVLSLDSRITSMNLLSFGYKQQSQWPYVDHIFLYNKLFLNLWFYLICSMHILISLQWLRMELYWDYDRDRTHTQLVVKHGLEM